MRIVPPLGCSISNEFVFLILREAVGHAVIVPVDIDVTGHEGLANTIRGSC